MPVFLARVGMQLPLDAPLPRQSAVAIPLQEAIEQRAASFGVPVDARIERGRTPRHALRMTIEHERFDRIVIAAAGHGAAGLGAEDVAWLLQTAPGEIVVLRPGAEDSSLGGQRYPVTARLVGASPPTRRAGAARLSREGGTAASRRSRRCAPSAPPPAAARAGCGGSRGGACAG